MHNMKLIKDMKALIPFIFGAIIVAFICKLGYDNLNLSDRNNRIRQQLIMANERNATLGESLGPILKRLDGLSQFLDEESKRRNVAESRATALQKENEFLRTSKQCSIAIDPKAVEDGRKEGNTVVIQAAPAGE